MQQVHAFSVNKKHPSQNEMFLFSMEITVAEAYTYDRLSCNLYDRLCRISTKNTLCACIQEGPGTVLSLMANVV